MMNTLIIMIPIMISIAFLTLMERKLMALAHFRLGPNKLGPKGLFQPFSDALKLVSKEMPNLSKSNSLIMMLAPIFIMSLAMFSWITQPTSSNTSKTNLNMLTFILISSVCVFFFISSGWASYSKYSILGAYRSTAQTISYEIAFLLILLPSIMFTRIMSNQKIHNINNVSSLLIMAPLFMLWVTTMLAETNRTPFDLTEGESELVSGYNTEYSNGHFSMIFIAEYGFIILMSMMTYILFLNNNNINMFYVITLIMMAFFSWTRVSFPRMRYDSLMYLSWKIAMPISILMFVITISLA